MVLPWHWALLPQPFLPWEPWSLGGLERPKLRLQCPVWLWRVSLLGK